jgi:RNA polymerase sigma factor (sigma-70 family)
MTTQTVDGSDEHLVAQSLAGDRSAYGRIVERYQSLICGVTFAGLGDVHRSEDLAQETFLEAWRHLANLKEPARLRAWLCGIARNLLAGDLRRRGRLRETSTEMLEQTPAPSAVSPAQAAISREEQSLIWGALERLPMEYREPMVLYYRQQESVAAMAAALDLTEEAARQRLVRGRAMLADRLEQILRRGLLASAPSGAFTTAVLAALPGVIFSAKASSLGAAVKGGAAAKAAVSSGMLASVLIGPILALLGGYFGYRNSLRMAVEREERKFMRRYAVQLLLMVVGFNAILWTVFDTPLRQRLGPMVVASAAVATMLIYGGLLALVIIQFNRGFRRIRAETVAASPMLAEAARVAAAQGTYEYRSRFAPLGLPLIHINFGSQPDARPRVAKGWLAFGAKAYGLLFAAGAIAVAPISFGAIGIGLITIGGFAAGAVAGGGVAIGGWAVGGLAIGWKAIGGFALGWFEADGGIAVARWFADGGIAIARHSGKEAAAVLKADPFFRASNRCLPYANWVWALWLLPVIPMAIRRWRRRSGTALDQT